ncbi:siderophore ABC transporter substrate-binding protein [Falsirhodobacter algicola]|uniref:ABC transporter substrate-binding protein n=1 Tax=Falsirhodobacter algicola TaxID=2692330 RepID=A0A8J8SKF1_9RHOB|nr:siderophore ABC transporter substrate-binding protein [Falsirhodobacter algicola]QUS35322.1 ABC transporter substrate-binding protein [Falsirhodobacter algicola]
MRMKLGAVLGGLCLAVAGSVSAQSITIPHRQGEVTLDSRPERVVVMDWANVDNLDALGVSILGVPGSNAPEYLSKFRSDDYLKLGSLQEPDVEGIAAADPDLVIVAARSRQSQPQLNRIAPTVDLSIDNDDFIDSVTANITELGEIFGKEDRAAEMNAELRSKVDRLHDAVQGKGRALTLVTSGGKIGVYGPESRTGWLHKEVGFPSVLDDVDDRSDRGDAASYEFILETNPDWIFVVDRDTAIAAEGGQAAAALLDNELVHQTTAWKEGHIVYLDPQKAYIVMNGYQAVSDLLDQVYEAVTADS